MTEKLKFCPFCGSVNIDPEGWAVLEANGEGDIRTGPSCDDCGASADSVEIWNTRAEASPAPATRWRRGVGMKGGEVQWEYSDTGGLPLDGWEAAPATAPAPEAMADMFAALTLAEDVLSRFPFTSEIWPNGTHPQAGMEQIRAALRGAAPPTEAT